MPHFLMFQNFDNTNEALRPCMQKSPPKNYPPQFYLARSFNKSPPFFPFSELNISHIFHMLFGAFHVTPRTTFHVNKCTLSLEMCRLYVNGVRFDNFLMLGLESIIISLSLYLYSNNSYPNNMANRSASGYILLYMFYDFYYSQLQSVDDRIATVVSASLIIVLMVTAVSEIK